jgi:hypothetical protein
MENIIIIVLLCIEKVGAQDIDTIEFSKKYYNMKSKFESLPNRKNEIIFLGNSITEQ